MTIIEIKRSFSFYVFEEFKALVPNSRLKAILIAVGLKKERPEFGRIRRNPILSRSIK